MFSRPAEETHFLGENIFVRWRKQPHNNRVHHLTCYRLSCDNLGDERSTHNANEAHEYINMGVQCHVYSAHKGRE